MRLHRVFVLLLVVLAIAPAVRAHPSAAHRIELLTREIEASPDDPMLYLRRGQAYSNEGMLDRALADLRRAESLGDPALVAYEVGVALYRRGDLPGARAAFDRFLERFPQHPPALEYRARVARDAGDAASALADFEAYFALQEDPNPGDYLSAARLVQDIEGGGAEAALRVLDRGMAKLGVIPQLQQPAIAIERARGRPAAAIARLETLAPQMGGSPDWKVEMGELLLASGRVEEARARLGEAGAQLEGLRVTAARRTLAERVESLLAASLRGRSDVDRRGSEDAP
ncbi:MAG: tetratricopeptide repeat protein [Spirochaetaceae bacterium]|nr:tetratricopeptide repeat protein [Myxococcales bacterium]MCB9726532.1 tetratricopeptide repeat protein [Spirochaetaceae bacterium]HPG24718.1 tetratricopeptide repeat protein [Myxococcota bacterium]